MKKLMFITVLIISSTFIFAQQKACCKKGMAPGAKCNMKTSVTADNQSDVSNIKCNHPADEPCDPATCPKAAAEAKANMQGATDEAATDEAPKCNHEKSWWRFWDNDDKDCCKKVNP